MFAASKTGAPASPPVYVEDVMSTYLYTGTSGSNTITNGIDLSTKGGLVWVKSRSGASSGSNHILQDTVRGANKQLRSNTTGAEGSDAVNWAFNSSGFSMNTSISFLNDSGTNYASWTFREQAKFFDVVTYTGNSTARTIAHNLGSVPGCIIVKATSVGGDNWSVYHRSLGYTKNLVLNNTDAAVTDSNYWNADPTSTVFSIGTYNEVNSNGATYIAYLFAHDAGGFGLTGTDNVISCGSFVSTSGNVSVTLGYEPQWLIIKNTTSAGSWNMVDVMRGCSVVDYQVLRANLSNAESSAGGPYIYPTATGFVFDSTAFGSSGQTYIYIAIRRGPMAVPTLGTSVFGTNVRTGTGSAASITGIGFPPDVIFNKTTAAAEDWNLFDKLRGRAKFLYPSYPTGESPASSATQDLVSFDQDGFSVGDRAYSQINFASRAGVNEIMRRAPSFLDVVCYTGTGSNTTFTHNLGAVPQLMIVKSRTASNNWDTYCSALANTQYLVLNSTAAAATGATRWNSTTPTSSVFSVGTSTTTNASADTFVAYLFATCPGVSKVGSYTGTAALQTVNCGFAAGARFVLIKRTDDVGAWYLWDSTRGISSGNDPYVLLSSSAAEVTGTNYVDTTAVGFQVTAAAPAAINANGGTFIFLAIA